MKRTRQTARRWSVTLALLGVTLALLGVTGLAACTAPVVETLPAPPAVTPEVFGAYLGPAAKGTNRLPSWDEWSGVTGRYGLDFAAADSWAAMSGPGWLLEPWRDAQRTLVLSLPMLPIPVQAGPESSATLAECANGNYDGHWATLGRNLVAYGLATTQVRPGWEFNGNWYPWAAEGRERDYVGCFRRIVKAMRAAPGQRFSFVWNVALGPWDFPAEWAFPGETYVDIVGISAYDSVAVPGTYPIPPDASDAERARRHEAAWQVIYAGDHGLRHWSDFAHRRGLRLAVPEWALTWLPDGHGGGDNPYYVDRMLDFIEDPENEVAFALYFDADSAVGGFHRVADPQTRFPRAAAQLQYRLRLWRQAHSRSTSAGAATTDGG